MTARQQKLRGRARFTPPNLIENRTFGRFYRKIIIINLNGYGVS
jgi:hypothetical protein